ncbi:zinc finger protein 184-like [Oppia nitens]|uniref:zinc finger protein 184-like n=1 Tax=Oppia nitens TaxID=1686743 RepID=UPI0023DC0EEF|nr:zinc finger protein 184-like [Oppia nitens]
MKHQSNNKTINLSLICNKKDNIIEYKCLDCDNKFLTRNGLMDHMFYSHKKQLVFQDNCINQQNADLLTKNDFKKNKCQLKGLTDSEKKNNEILIKTKRKQPKSRKRKSINDKNNDQLDKQRVIRSKPGGYKCLNSDCQMTFKTSRKYKKHQMTCVVTCPQCDKKYKCQKSYVFHQMKEHGSGVELPYKCDYNDCNYQTASLYSFRFHKLSKHTTNKQFVCPIADCSKAFKFKTQYNRHLAEHRSEPTLKCREKDCRQLFYTDKEIYRHRIVDHKRKIRKKPKPYKQCDWPGCDYYGQALARHKLVHTGEKNFPCHWPECGKRFTGKQKLIEHMNIHNNVKPYACRWPGCEYRCASNSNINKHMKQIHHQ